MLQVPCPVRAAGDNAAFNSHWRSCKAVREPMVAVHVYELDQALVYVSAVPSGQDFPEHVVDAVHGILIKYPVVVGVGDELDVVAPEEVLSARMTVGDAKVAADEIATYLILWRAGLAVDGVAST